MSQEELGLPSSVLLPQWERAQELEGERAQELEGAEAEGGHTGRLVRVTHINGISLEYAQLQEELQLDLALLEELLHLGLGLVQLLQHRLDVTDGAVVGGLVAGDRGVPAKEQGGQDLSATNRNWRRRPHTVRPQIWQLRLQREGGRQEAGLFVSENGISCPPCKTTPASSPATPAGLRYSESLPCPWPLAYKSSKYIKSF